MERSTSSRALRGAAFGALALGLAGCAGGGFGDRDRGRDGLYMDLAGEIVTYRCDDDRSFQAAYSRDLSEVRVDTANGNYRLELADRDRNGYEYRSRGDGDDVRLTVDRRNAKLRVADRADFTDCQMRRT